jgi:hypothetical protein
MPFAFLLLFINECFGLLFVFWIHSISADWIKRRIVFLVRRREKEWLREVPINSNKKSYNGNADKIN